MIKRYNKTSLSDFFKYNDPQIAAWADNVYEKIRQSGELANYIEREKASREHFTVVDGTTNPPIEVVDDRFTFGQAYSGDLLTIDNSLRENIGRIYDIEFELLFNEISFIDIFLMDSNIVIHNTPSIVIHGLTFSGFTAFNTGQIYQIRISRVNNTVSLYIDKVLIGTSLLSSDIDTEFTVLYSSDQGALPDNFTLSVNSLTPNSGVTITTSNLDINGDSDGNTQFNRIYAHGTAVTFTAPLTTPDNNFKRWILDGINQPQGLRTMTVIMNANHTITALFVIPTLFYNAERSQTFTRNNCIGGLIGSDVPYVVAAGSYSSLISQADADAQAAADIASNGQTYANDNGTCSVVYWNVEESQAFTRNDCEIGYSGSSETYVVAAHTYSSFISQIDANNQALAEIAVNGQIYANVHGTCGIYFNVEVSNEYTRDDCGSGYVGSTELYTVSAGTYSSAISQVDADSKATADMAVNGQNYANTNGTCTVMVIGLVNWSFAAGMSTPDKYLKVWINGNPVVNVTETASSNFHLYEGDIVIVEAKSASSGDFYGESVDLVITGSGTFVNYSESIDGFNQILTHTFTWTTANGTITILSRIPTVLE